MAESMLGEPSDVSRVLFPPDYTTASVMMSCVYQTRGQVWTAVVSKNEAAPDLFTLDEAQTLLRDGAARLDWAGHAPDGQRVVITAVGSYQLEEAVKASNRLRERGIPHTLVYMLEPGRFRTPRSDGEAAHAAEGRLVQDLYPGSVEARVFVTHTRPEPLLGALQPLHTGHRKTKGLGYIGKGGTLTAPGMLFVNRSTWAHIVETVANVLETPREDILSVDELAAIDFKRSPEGVLI
jgi:phosphoketolase